MKLLAVLEQAIIKTLVYRDLFDYPLAAEEIYRFLIGLKSSPKAVEEALQKMVVEGKVQKHGDYYFLPGREEIVARRQVRGVISKEKFKKAARYAKLLRLIPWVKAVFATGALAVGNADEKSDLDFLIFTSPRRLWMTRGLAFLIFSLLGVKRSSREKQTTDKVCPNMFLSLTALATPDGERNLYTAHEVVQARPIWERGRVHQRFLAENSWVGRFFPNFELPSQSDECQLEGGLVIGDWLEALAYKVQLKYMEKKRTREVVTPDRILFHPIDRAAEILPKFEERLKRLASSPLRLDS